MTKSQLPLVLPLATMQEAWAMFDRSLAASNRLRDRSVLVGNEHTRLLTEGDCQGTEYDRHWAECDRLRAEYVRLHAEGDRLCAEGTLVVIVTARALYGEDAQINWRTRTTERGV